METKRTAGKKTLSLLLALLMACGYAGLFAGLTAGALTVQTPGRYQVQAFVTVTDSMYNANLTATLFGRGENGRDAQERAMGSFSWDDEDTDTRSYEIFNGLSEPGVFPTRVNVCLADNKYYVARELTMEIHLLINGVEKYLTGVVNSSSGVGAVTATPGLPATFYWKTGYNVLSGKSNSFNCDFCFAQGETDENGDEQQMPVLTSSPDGGFATDQYGVNWQFDDGSLRSYAQKCAAEYYYPAGTLFVKNVALCYYQSWSSGLSSIKEAVGYQDADGSLYDGSYHAYIDGTNAAGYVYIDLTKGTGGKYYVFAGYTLTDDPSQAACAIGVETSEWSGFSNSAAVPVLGAAWWRCNSGADAAYAPMLHADGAVNLNVGATSRLAEELHLYAAYDPTYGPAIDCFTVISQDDGEAIEAEDGRNYFLGDGWYSCVALNAPYQTTDLNRHAGGDYLFGYYHTPCVAVDSAALRQAYVYARHIFEEHAAGDAALEAALDTAAGILDDLQDGYTTSDQTEINAAALALYGALGALGFTGAQGAWRNQPAATCESDGAALSACPVCEENLKLQTLAPGHLYGAWAEQSAPTCTQSADSLRTCARCGRTEEMTIPALGHSYTERSVTEPTCTEPGEELLTCIRCGGMASGYPKTTDALGHEYASEHFEDESGGYTVYTCIRNDDSYTVYDPSPVTGLTAQGAVNAVSLTWDSAADETVTGYVIYRSATEVDGYAEIGRNGSRDACAFTDTAVSVGETFYYTVSAVNESAEGKTCAPVSAAAQPDAESPVVTALSPASYSTLSGSVAVTATARDNVAVVGFEASYSADGGETWIPVASIEGASCAFTFDTTAVADGVILFRVLALDGMGNAGGHNRTVTYKIDNTGPAQVENLAAVVVYPTQLTVSWARPLDEDTDRFVLQQECGGVTTTLASSIRTLGYNVSGLSPNTAYRFRVMAVDAYGNEGAYSEWLTVTTTEDVSAPVVTAQSNNAGAYNASVAYTATVKDDYAVASVEVQCSTDKETWTPIETFTFSGGQKQVNVSRTIDLSAFAEGSLFVRAVGTDAVGNAGDASADAPFVEYYIDRTAPDAVSPTSAAVNDKNVQVRWPAADASDVVSYSLYRSVSPDDGYTRIAQRIQALVYTDTGAARNTTYYYKVCAVDRAGNAGPLGGYCSATVGDDELPPAVNAVSPRSGVVGPISKTVSVTVSDNDGLRSLAVSYKREGDADFAVLSQYELSGTSRTVSFDLPLAEWAHGESVQLKFECEDAVGLTSAPAYVSYTPDKTAPGVAALAVSAAESSATLTWSDCGESDLSGFEIFRCDGSAVLVGKRAANASGRYTLTDNVTRESVRYRIDAVDRYGNRNSVYTDEVSTRIVLKAAITLPDRLMAESELVFSAASSVSAFGIASCEWTFSDGETGSDETFTRTFSEAGGYSVTLTLTDTEGNTASASKYFTVRALAQIGTLKVTVLSESGDPVGNCGVYIDLGSDGQETVYTGSSGVAQIELTAGTHGIDVYRDGYLPRSGTATVTADETAEITFTLTEQNVVTGDFEVHEMNFEEIVAAGIDISDPANQQIYKVTVTLIYGEERVPVTYIRTANEIKEYTISDFDPSYRYALKYIPNDDNKEIIAVVRLPIKASYLKQFFMATLTIFNNAEPAYRLVNCAASIPVPEGLTAMSVKPIDPVIAGGASSCQTVVLRGDVPGTYSLTADFTGTLEKFNKTVNASFTSNSFQVYGKNDVALVVEIPRQTVGRFRFNIGLENRRGSAVYAPQIEISDMVLDITSLYKKILREDASYDENDVKDLGFKGIGAFVRRADGGVTTYEDCVMPVDTIEAGGGVFLEYETKDMPGDGAQAWFMQSIVACEDRFGGYVEVRFIEDNIVSLSADEYVAEHLRFANSDDYAFASFDFAGYMHDLVKDSAQYKELAILDWGLSDVSDEIFNELNDAIAADYIKQVINAATEDHRIEIKFMQTFSDVMEKLSDMLITRDEVGELSPNKIDQMFKGVDFDSNTYSLMRGLLCDDLETETIQFLFGSYDVMSNLSDVYHEMMDQYDRIRSLTLYYAAVQTYRSVDQEIKDNLLATANAMENSRLKTALLRYANTAIDEEHYRTEIWSMLTHKYLGSVYHFIDFMVKPILKDFILRESVRLVQAFMPYVDTAFIAADVSISLGMITAGRAVLSALSGAHKQREALKLLIRLADATKASGAVLAQAKDSLLANRDIASAKTFDTAYKAFKRWTLMAYAAFEDYGNALTENFLAKYIVKKSREENLAGIADVIVQENRLKGTYCHTMGHEYYGGVKVLAAACPVDVRLYAPDGSLAAQVTANEAEVFDELVSCCVFEEGKLFAVPAALDYRIEITANGAGTMDYTVFEYLDGTERREISFPTQTITAGDVFEGGSGTQPTEVPTVYTLVKNDADAVSPDNVTEIDATGIVLDEEEVALDVGNTRALTATVTTEGNAAVAWRSSDESVFTVDANGVLTAKAVGEATVYAVSVDGGYIDTAAVTVFDHVYNEGAQTKAPTCTAPGVCVFTCVTCGSEKTEEVAPRGHAFGEWTTYVAPTCTQAGTEQRVCENDASHVETRTVAPRGHAFGEWTTYVAPTCTEVGVERRVCANDASHVETRTVAALGHTDGNGDDACDRCGVAMETDAPAGKACKWCGEVHIGFLGKLIGFFHSLVYFFAHLFGKK